MENFLYKIGKEWINLDPNGILLNIEFRSTPRYNNCIEEGKARINGYVDKNEKLLSLISEECYQNNYALRQLIYCNTCLSSIVTRLQIEGRHYYYQESLKKVKQAIASEYANLPEFFRDAYSIDDIAANYVNRLTKDLTSKINKAAAEYFYQVMRKHIRSIL